MYVKPWYHGDSFGNRYAMVIDYKYAKKILNRCKNPIIIAGELLSRDKEAIDIISKARYDIVSTTPKTYIAFKDRDRETYYESLNTLINLLKSDDWKGFNGKEYDLAVFIGIFHQLLIQMISTLRNFSNVITMNASRFYVSIADYSFPNLDRDTWLEYLRKTFL